jgi:ribosomal protein S18 acetylase RimI-like enzyme
VFDHEALPPSAAELAAIEHERIRWVTLLGASLEQDARLGVTFASHDRRGSGLNFAAAIRWPAAEVDGRLRIVGERMRAAGVWPQVVVCDGLTEPADLPQRLRAAGWVPIGGERIMWTRHPAVVPHLDPGLRIEAVTPATAQECVRLEAANFGLDPDAIADNARLLAQAVAAGETRAFLVRLAREAIASARMMPGSGVASLHAIGVAARHRRRGYGRLITAIATRAGLATGHKLVWLSVDETNVAAVELYRGLDFKFTFTWSRWLAPGR